MTRLTPAQLSTFRTTTAGAPFRLSMPRLPSRPVADVDGVLVWLDLYVEHVRRQEAKLREEDMVRARAAVVLRGLRQNLANALDTLGELDDAIEAGTLEVAGKLDDLADVEAIGRPDPEPCPHGRPEGVRCSVCSPT